MTVPDHAAAKAVTARHKDRMLGLPGVTGIFTGEKRVGGAKTGQRSVVVTVAQKKPLSEIPKRHRIPATLDGVPTDVIEEVFRPCDDLTRYNPLKGGARISVTPEEDSSFSAGTAGMIVTDAGTGDPMILSCWHVLYGAGLGSAGDIVVNPPYAGGDPTHDKVGKTTRFALTSQVDAAVARVEGRAPSRTIIDIGKPTEIEAASVDMAVRKRGATSGLTNGVVTATDWSGLIDYGSPTGVVSFSNMIRFEGAPGMVLGGDSGSVLVVDADAGDDLFGVNLDNWEEANPTFTNGPSTLVVSAEGRAYYPSISVDYATDWHVEATAILNASANPHEVAVGIGNASGSSLQFGVLIYDTGPDAVTASARSSSETDSGTLLGPGDDIAVVLDWDAASETLTWSVDDGTTAYDGAVVCGSGAPAFALHPIFACTGTDPDFGAELTAFSLAVG